MNLFVDTCALVKLYHQEDGTDTLSNFIAINSEDLFITLSDLSKIELHSALLKRVRIHEISYEKITEIFSLFENDFFYYNIIEINPQIRNLSIQLLDEYGLNKSLFTLDALQLSSAIFTHQFFRIDYFVSSDKRLLNIAKDFFNILNPLQM